MANQRYPTCGAPTDIPQPYTPVRDPVKRGLTSHPISVVRPFPTLYDDGQSDSLARRPGGASRLDRSRRSQAGNARDHRWPQGAVSTVVNRKKHSLQQPTVLTCLDGNSVQELDGLQIDRRRANLLVGQTQHFLEPTRVKHINAALSIQDAFL